MSDKPANKFLDYILATRGRLNLMFASALVVLILLGTLPLGPALNTFVMMLGTGVFGLWVAHLIISRKSLQAGAGGEFVGGPLNVLGVLFFLAGCAAILLSPLSLLLVFAG